MDSEMQFGDLEEAAPKAALRPDRNRHFAVRAFGNPNPDDLPVFVDLDALRQMEYHAVSNLDVELGGVMLGGQYLDSDSQPFVLVTDVLQAEHYESTKGSFKFTHDTWSEITRQLAAFPEEMQIVGWYHTHPDWGVFLSGMDMFICQNFFNKPLDVAFVIDPCRGDRGMFYWRQPDAGQKKCAAGFYVVASRFRSEELDLFVQQLEEQADMATRTRSVGPAMGNAPLVHIIERNSSGLMTALVGMLVMQFCLVALLAWRMGAVPLRADSSQQSSEIAKLSATLEDLLDDQRQVLEADAKLEVVNRILEQEGQGSEMASALVERDQQIAQLRASLAGLDGLRAQNEQTIEDLRRSNNAALRREKSLNEKLLTNAKSLERQRVTISELEEQLADLRGEGVAGEDGDSIFAIFENRWVTVASIVGGVMVVGLCAVVAATLIARRRSQQTDDGDVANYNG